MSMSIILKNIINLKISYPIWINTYYNNHKKGKIKDIFHKKVKINRLMRLNYKILREDMYFCLPNIKEILCNRKFKIINNKQAIKIWNNSLIYNLFKIYNKLNKFYCKNKIIIKHI